MPITFWNRKKSQLESEAVYGDLFVRALYGNSLGYGLTDSLLSRKFFSKLYGVLQSSSLSKHKVPGFVEKFKIPMEDFEPGPFSSFNAFFVRKFREGKRNFPHNPNLLGAPAEARYFAFENASSLSVKGVDLNPEELLKGTPQKDKFLRGPCLLARLCPVDYHRFHFPADGRIVHFHEEHGKLHSVNPLALQKNAKIFLENERHITVLDTKDFGLLAYVEVGALCVGKIQQTHPLGRPFQRGDEKGYFLFGASTVILFGEPGAWIPDADLLEKTKSGIECLVELGSPLAKK